MKNKIEIKLRLTETDLKKIKTIPTFRDLFWKNQLDKLKVGDNILTVNHTVYGKLKRMFSVTNLNK